MGVILALTVEQSQLTVTDACMVTNGNLQIAHKCSLPPPSETIANYLRGRRLYAGSFSLY